MDAWLTEGRGQMLSRMAVLYAFPFLMIPVCTIHGCIVFKRGSIKNKEVRDPARAHCAAERCGQNTGALRSRSPDGGGGAGYSRGAGGLVWWPRLLPQHSLTISPRPPSFRWARTLDLTRVSTPG